MKQILLFVFIITIHQLLVAQPTIAFPIKQSADRHYLVDNNNKPIFLHGDAAWRLSYMLAMPEVKEYLQKRKQQGFNTLIIELTPDLLNDVNRGDQPNIYNEHVFINQDISKPNDKFFKHADSVLEVCNQMNFTVFLFPLYTGCCTDGWKEIMEEDTASAGKAYNYGEWVANRYKHLPNIVWVSGGDYDETPQSMACAMGIASVDSSHLHSFHLSPGNTSHDRLSDAKWLTLNLAYTYYPELPYERKRELQVYAQFFHEWQKDVDLPIVMGESSYEYERDATTQFIRRQAYWSLLSGSSGHIFGQRDIYPFNKNWRDGLNTPGVQSMEIFGKFVQTIPWSTMQPDWSATLFVSGRGDFNNGTYPGGEEYATGALSDDTTIGVIYTPTYRKTGVNMSRFNSAVTAKWFDPTNGIYTNVSGVFKNDGIYYFTPPKLYNEQGFDDWVLILQVKK